MIKASETSPTTSGRGLAQLCVTSDAVMTLAVLGFSLPIFVVAYLLIYGLAMALDVFPIQGYKP